MKHFKISVLLPGLTIVFCVAASLIDQSAATSQNTPPKASTREDAYRANNIGVALLEQYKHKEAADAFRRALQLEPTLTIARINLGIALFNVPDLLAAQRELQSAATATPTAPQPHYVLGLLAKAQNKPAEAIVEFQKVLAIDPQDVGANVNLGQLYAQQRKYAEAVTVLRTGLAAEPYNTTALYNLGTALIRAGQREEGQKIIQQFQALRERGSGTTLGTNYLEQGRYAEAILSIPEQESADMRVPEVTFTDVTSTVLPAGEWMSPDISVEKNGGGAIVLFDYDLDGDLDLLEVAVTRQRLARNTFTGKTYNSLENISQYFAERGMAFPSKATAPRHPVASRSLPALTPKPGKPARTGMTVEHPKYGTGTVVRREGEGVEHAEFRPGTADFHEAAAGGGQVVEVVLGQEEGERLGRAAGGEKQRDRTELGGQFGGAGDESAIARQPPQVGDRSRPVVRRARPSDSRGVAARTGRRGLPAFSAEGFQ